jgi:hypothetical protein
MIQFGLGSFVLVLAAKLVQASCNFGGGHGSNFDVVNKNWNKLQDGLAWASGRLQFHCSVMLAVPEVYRWWRYTKVAVLLISAFSSFEMGQFFSASATASANASGLMSGTLASTVR